MLAHGVTDRRWRHRWRKLKKIARIGPLGALVGWLLGSFLVAGLAGLTQR